MDQLVRIFKLCGSPTPKTMPRAHILPNWDHVKNSTFMRSLEVQHSKSVSLDYIFHLSKANISVGWVVQV